MPHALKMAKESLGARISPGPAASQAIGQAQCTSSHTPSSDSMHSLADSITQPVAEVDTSPETYAVLRVECLEARPLKV